METRVKNTNSKTQIDFEISKGQPRSTRYDFSIRTTAPPGGWGGGVLNKFFYGVAPSQSPTPFPFMYHFSRKSYPFRIPSSIDKWYPFHIPCLELSIPFTAVNAIYLILNRPINRKNRTFSRLYKAIKFSHMLALLGSFTDPLQIFLPFRILQQVKSLPFHILEA